MKVIANDSVQSISENDVHSVARRTKVKSDLKPFSNLVTDVLYTLSGSEKHHIDFPRRMNASTPRQFPGTMTPDRRRKFDAILRMAETYPIKK